MSENIFGCFLKIGFDPKLSAQEALDLANEFRVYLWGEKGICDKMKKLNSLDYGVDLKLALFEFNVKPTQAEIQALKEVGSYRPKEKSVAIPIIIDQENFFSKSDEQRNVFLKEAVLSKFDLLRNVVEAKKLDTKMDKLRIDLQNILE